MKLDLVDLGEQIIKSIQIIIDRKLSNYKADRTFASVVKQKNSNGTYIVLDESGGERKVKCCIPNVDLKVGQRVWVKIPLGNLKQIHICGVA